MPTVDVTVNGRRHTVQCGVGEETRVKALAAYIDQKVNQLAQGNHHVGDARLMLMASLLVADELSDANDQIRRLETSLQQQANGSEQHAAECVERVAQHLDAIATSLEST